MNGLSVIPEGRVTKDCKQQGSVFEVSKIQNLEKYLEYSSLNGLGVIYLTSERGIVYQDEVISASSTPMYKYPFPKRKIWVSVVVEQIVRECIMFSTRKVYFMIDKLSCYALLVEELKRRGVDVKLPFIGI